MKEIYISISMTHHYIVAEPDCYILNHDQQLYNVIWYFKLLSIATKVI